LFAYIIFLTHDRLIVKLKPKEESRLRKENGSDEIIY